MNRLLPALLLVSVLLTGCGGGGGGGSSDRTQANLKLLAFNDLGMHCMDEEFSVFSILPPFNVVHAQAVAKRASGPRLLGIGDIQMTYSAVKDADGSINSTSLRGKTDFWDHAQDLFGISLNAGEGLTGLYMPQDHPSRPGPQEMDYHAADKRFSAEGIPITSIDDDALTNAFPLMRVRALNQATGVSRGRLDIVVPVSTETDCQSCHFTGGVGTLRGGIAWAGDADPEVRTKKNILLLHDFMEGTDLISQTPVLCSQCHYSLALDLNGTGPAGDQVGNPSFSRVMHEYHGNVIDQNGDPAFPAGGTVDETCYQCHPGQITQCQRGAMKTGGMECFDCHGDMIAVGGENPLLAGGSIDGANDGGSRRPWMDLPRCQSCHTGDAVDHLSGAGMVLAADGIRLVQAYLTGDDSASPIQATNTRFAENPDSLYRMSKGHGGIHCAGCHGSTHAIWPHADPTANDNVAARQIQGHRGTISECSACHASGSLPLTTNGPHGLHNIDDPDWADGGHEDFYEDDEDSCKACHGPTLTGTPLAKVQADRRFRVEDQTVNYNAGDLVRCDRCHEMPD